MIYNEIIQGNDFSKNLISFESEKYILFDCEIYSEFFIFAQTFAQYGIHQPDTRQKDRYQNPME